MECMEVIGGIKLETPIVKLEELDENKTNVVEICVKDLKSEDEPRAQSDDEYVFEIGIEDIENVEAFKHFRGNIQNSIEKEEITPNQNGNVLKDKLVLNDPSEYSGDDDGSVSERYKDIPRINSTKIENVTKNRADIKTIQTEKNKESRETGRTNHASNQFHTEQQTLEGKNKSEKINHKEHNVPKIVDGILNDSNNNQNGHSSQENDMPTKVSSSERPALTQCPKMEYSSEDEDNYFSCYHCDYKAKTISSVKQHESIHIPKTQVGESLLKCPHCPATYKLKRSFVYHVRVVHSSAEVVRLGCKHCAYTCKKKGTLENHILFHHEDPAEQEILKCDKCSYKTISKNYLSIHMKTTHGSLDYQCHICSYRASHYERLRLHLIGHKKDKSQDLRYLCDQCDYRTYRTYSLQVHKLNHLKPDEVKYFCCHHCNFKAKRKDNLKSHIIRHFKKGDVTLSCYICDFTTKKRDKLTHHIEKHSKEEKKK